MRWRAGLLLALVSVVACLATVELVGRRFVHDPLGLFRPSALLGYEMAPDYRGRHHKLRDFDVAIRTDARGLRMPDRAQETHDGVALFLGDSVTFGWGVEAGETWPAQVAERSAAAGVAGPRPVNAGVWGYDTPQELAFLRGGAAGYRPQMVVVGLTTPVTPTRNWYCHERGVITLEPLLSDATGVFGPMAAFLKNNSHVYSFLERRVRFRGSLLPAGWQLPGFGASDAAVPAPSMPLDESAALTAGLVGELRDEAQRGGAAIAVVIFPSLDQVLELAAEPQPEPSRERILREDLVRRLRASGIPSLDLTELLAAEPDREELFLPRDPVHPSRRGHARSADAARTFLAATYPGQF